jgi:deferrochelatase/peroxidase EfeB
MRIDLGGVQGTIAHLYKCPVSRHLIFRFGDCDGGRAFLRGLAPRLTMADLQLETTPDPLLNVGITFGGLEVLGVDPLLLDELDAVYKAGPDPEALGDAPGSRSDPANWWDGRFSSSDVHCIVHIYVRSNEALETASDELRELAGRSGVTELIPRADGTVLDGRSLGRGKLHFGYTDGISHPDIGWDDDDGAGRTGFRHFLLGYSTPEQSSAPAPGPAADLFRDSAYGVFRWIYQDVATFDRFLSTTGPGLFPDLAPADAEELLAAKLMGRWRDGTPLVLAPDRPDAALTRSNDFAYASQDPAGHRCPFSAHVRVVNPRDERLDPIVDGVPHLIRRGMPYGAPLDSSEDDGRDRGILGLFLCADMRRQVYSLTGWIKKNDFSPVYDGNRRVQDALVANRAVHGTEATFTVPGAAGDKRIVGLPDFVHTKGTVFLLYPSKATMDRLAA